MDDIEFVEGILQKLFKQEYWDKYRPRLLKSIGRVKCDEKKNLLVQNFIQEVGILRPEVLLIGSPESDGEYGRVEPNAVPVKKSGCSKCP